MCHMERWSCIDYNSTFKMKFVVLNPHPGKGKLVYKWSLNDNAILASPTSTPYPEGDFEGQEEAGMQTDTSTGIDIRWQIAPSSFARKRWIDPRKVLTPDLESSANRNGWRQTKKESAETVAGCMLCQHIDGSQHIDFKRHLKRLETHFQPDQNYWPSAAVHTQDLFYRMIQPLSIVLTALRSTTSLQSTKLAIMLASMFWIRAATAEPLGGQPRSLDHSGLLPLQSMFINLWHVSTSLPKLPDL